MYLRTFLLGTLILLIVSQIPVLVSAQEHSEVELSAEAYATIADVRSAIADFRDIDTAIEAGYGIFQGCFKNDDVGGMGQHYVNGELAGDDVADPLNPEALVYEPQEDGSLILVALEYLIFDDNWNSDAPPTLFGQDFHLKTDIPETPPVWALHLWLWTHNPEGMFADYNPTVFCPAVEGS